MTIAHDLVATQSWIEPEGVAARGTLFLLPGRGESPQVYERFGRRLSADAYRVHAVNSPGDDAGAVRDQLTELFATADPAVPRVLIGSDAGAAFAAQLATRAVLPGLSGLVLAGLPTSAEASAATDWDDELNLRTACSAHRRRISTDGVRPAGLFESLPVEWFDAGVPAEIRVPVLGLHGHDDAVSPFGTARSWYASVPRAELFGFVGGRHDVLNDQTHRTVAATVVLFLERLRQGSGLLPIAVPEPLPAASRGRAPR